MKSWRFIVPIALFVLLVGFLLAGLGRDPHTLPSPLIGKPAPTFELPRLQRDGSLGVQAFRGRPVLVNVFASWCLPCLEEHPVLLDLSRRNLLPILGINYKDQKVDADRWLRRHGNPFSDVVADADGRVSIDYGVYGVPETYLIDAGGVIRYKRVGPLTPEVVRNELLPALQGLAR